MGWRQWLSQLKDEAHPRDVTQRSCHCVADRHVVYRQNSSVCLVRAFAALGLVAANNPAESPFDYPRLPQLIKRQPSMTQRLVRRPETGSDLRAHIPHQMAIFRLMDWVDNMACDLCFLRTNFPETVWRMLGLRLGPPQYLCKLVLLARQFDK